jgi:hypothetical protein
VALLATLLIVTNPAVSLSSFSLFVLIRKENTRGTIEELRFRLVLRQQKSLRTPRQTAVTSVDIRGKFTSVNACVDMFHQQTAHHGTHNP